MGSPCNEQASLLEGEFLLVFSGSICEFVFANYSEFDWKVCGGDFDFSSCKGNYQLHNYSNRIGPSKHLRSEVRGSTGPLNFFA